MDVAAAANVALVHSIAEMGQALRRPGILQKLGEGAYYALGAVVMMLLQRAEGTFEMAATLSYLQLAAPILVNCSTPNASCLPPKASSNAMC